ncbi:MAG: hypothetical protein QW404_02550 [Candidatus Nanoarchaeia archaeon]
MVLQSISFYMIGGMSVVAYLSILTILLLFTTAILGFMSMRGKVRFKYHKILAIITVISAIVHGALIIISRF